MLDSGTAPCAVWLAKLPFAKPNKAKCLKGKKYKYPVSLIFTQLASGETGACEPER